MNSPETAPPLISESWAHLWRGREFENSRKLSLAQQKRQSRESRTNPAGVTLERYLRIRFAQLRYSTEKLHKALSAHRIKGDAETYHQKLTSHNSLHQRLLNSCIEDWAIYVEPCNESFVQYVHDYALYNPDWTGRRTEESLSHIFNRRLEFDWLIFEPGDYHGLAADIYACHLSGASERAERRRLANHRWNWSWRGDGKARRLDAINYEQMLLYLDSRREQDTEVNSEYLRDILRFSGLFIVAGDPVPEWDASELPASISRALAGWPAELSDAWRLEGRF